jgi:hypothetical protein
MKIFLSEGQVRKIKTAINKNESINLKIDGSKAPNTTLPFIPKINPNGTITLNKTQLKQVGGFLPLLAAAVPAIAKAVGIGAASYFGSQVAKKITGNGLKLPNKDVPREALGAQPRPKVLGSVGSGSGLKLPNKGSGLKLPNKDVSREALGAQPRSKMLGSVGSGLKLSNKGAPKVLGYVGSANQSGGGLKLPGR